MIKLLLKMKIKIIILIIKYKRKQLVKAWKTLESQKQKKIVVFYKNNKLIGQNC